MKSIKNLLQSTEKNNQLKANELLKVKGGSLVVEAVIDVTISVDGATSLVYCDRRRRRVG